MGWGGETHLVIRVSHERRPAVLIHLLHPVCGTLLPLRERRGGGVRARSPRQRLGHERGGVGDGLVDVEHRDGRCAPPPGRGLGADEELAEGRLSEVHDLGVARANFSLYGLDEGPRPRELGGLLLPAARG